MPLRDPLGDRMKEYERKTRTELPRKTHTILRLDGRAFHAYLRGADKPFDHGFVIDMAFITKALCEEVSGTVCAYTQSDEISILMTDLAAPGTEPWFGGEVQKIVSVSAALATGVLVRRRPESLGRPAFDARVFTIDDPVEVANYFIWRQRDAQRNSVSMAASAHFSPRQLHRAGMNDRIEMLAAEGVDWGSYPARFRLGQLAARRSGASEVSYTDKRTGEQRTVMAERSWWEVSAAPVFTAENFAESVGWRTKVA